MIEATAIDIPPPSRDGRDGVGIKGDRGLDGQAGRDGIDGVDGVSVVNANIDFDGSLIVTLSDGREINVGEVVTPDIAEKIKVISTMSTNAAIAIKDEGTSITSAVKNINFVGATVTATNSGDDVTVNVSAGTGTVTSVAASGGTGISVSGSPITTTGTLTITNTAPDQTVSLTASTGISTSGTYPIFTITNTAPDQTVVLTAGTGINTSGTYPSFTVTNSAPDQTVALTAGTGISTSGTYPNFTVTNSAPDQTVALTQGGTTTITGTYPNFTISSADQFQGTVTSVTGTSPVASSGGATPAISLSAGYGDTLNPYASKTANFVLAAPNGSAGVPTFRAIVAADIPTLNQNTTGTASNVTGTVAVANGGTGVITSTGSGNNVLSTSPTLLTPIVTTTIGVGGVTPSASGAGITFPATQSESTSANTLDDYEEGTWTPVLTFGTTNQTITINLATYVKIGKSVTINMQITWAAKVSSGRVFISGLPFAKEGGGTIALLAGCPAGTVTTLAAIFYNVDGGGTVLNFAEQAGDINSASLAASGALFCSGTYFV